MEADIAAIVCALIAAMLIAVGMVAQHLSAATAAPDEDLMSQLLRTPRWWAGVIGEGGAYVMQAIALALGSVLVVQPLLVASLLFALPLSARFSGLRITGRTWGLALALTAALVVFLVVGDPTEGALSAPAQRWLIPLGLVLAVAVAAAVLAWTPLPPRRQALLFGVAGGTLYGVSVAFTKYVVDRFEHGAVALVSSWQTWALVAAGITGFYLQQKAFQVAPLSASMPALTIAEPIAAVFLGITVLGERLRTGEIGMIIVGCAVLVMIVTALQLSRAQSGIGESPQTPV